MKKDYLYPTALAFVCFYVERIYSRHFWEIFYSVIALIIIAMVIFLKPGFSIPHLIFSVLATICAIAMVFNQFKRKITLTTNLISKENIFGRDELNYTDISGFRVGDKAIYIYPVDGRYSKISIRDYSSIANEYDLINSLRDKLPDLDLKEAAEERDDILQNSGIAPTAADREAFFKRNKKIAMYYNIGGIVIFILGLILATNDKIKNNKSVDLILLLYPIVGLIIMGYSKGLIKIFSKKNSALSHIGVGLYVSTLIIFIKSIVDYHIIFNSSVWLPFGCIAIAFFTAEFTFSIRNTPKTFFEQIVIGSLLCLAFSYTATLQLNCAFDNSTAKIYYVKVSNKYITRKQHTLYHIKLDVWKYNSESDIQVREATYNKTFIGASIPVKLKAGFLQIPWYYIDK